MTIISRGSTVYSRVVARLPWQLSIVVGLVCVALGVVLVFRPFVSLTALLVLLAIGLIAHGVSELIRADQPWTAVAIAVIWVVAGTLSLVLPGLTIGALTVIVASALIVTGALGALRAVRGVADQRVAELMLAAASIVLGVVALLWPDVTVFVVAALFGVRMVVFGVDQIVGAIRRARGVVTPAPAATVPRVGWRRWVRTATAALALVGSAGLLFVSTQLSGTPQPDSFYSAPADLPAEPGQLLRSEPFTRTIPDGATGWRILYTTTTDEGQQAVASALVVVPDGAGEHPVIAWAHGTTGFGTGCAPSLLAEPFVAGAMPDFAEALDQGWAIVATDYVGLGTEGAHPYLVGQGEARSVLDSIRAAQQLSEAQLAAQTVIWGHSQGGHAALWAGGLAEAYAPELDLKGVAAMAPASNLPALLSGVSDSAVGGVFGSFALGAYVAAYPEVRADDYVRPGARLMVQSMQQRCLTDPSTLVSIATSVFSGEPVWSQNPGEGALGARALENVPTQPIGAPLLIAQGQADTLVLPQAQQQYVDERCAAGQALEYRTYPGRDHMGVVTGDSPLLTDLLTWTSERFAGVEPVSTCG